MGTFSVDIEVAAVGGNLFKKLNAIVDTGATYTLVPRSVLAGPGVQAIRESPVCVGG
jgi:predicted aspartyl protease